MYTEETTNAELLADWDAGRPVFVIEMGGLGPGYEQCIQIVTMELVRRFKDDARFSSRELWEKMSEEERIKAKAEVDEAVHEIDRKERIQLSGAQAGAAMNQAYHFLLEGYGTSMVTARKMMPDRIIQASKNWASLKAEPAPSDMKRGGSENG